MLENDLSEIPLITSYKILTPQAESKPFSLRLCARFTIKILGAISDCLRTKIIFCPQKTYDKSPFEDKSLASCLSSLSNLFCTSI
jgi:hypothetical protein